MIRHIYVHIPFCARICPYCAFYKDLLDKSQTQRFCDAIVAELAQQSQHRQLSPSTIYFGGGTPTALTTDQLEYVLDGFRKHLDLTALSEWTMEANPGSVSARKARLLRESRVSRISLGVQSWNDDLLSILGREHNAAQAEESFRILRDAGFENINVDLMFGLPGQTIEQWETTLQKTVSLKPDHISAYCLTFEEDTDFFLRFSRGELHQDSDADAQLFRLAISMLENAGYHHYEISNYARPGFESVHNRAYWAGEDYLGIGPSAFSTVGMKRWQNLCDYRAYADRVLAGDSAVGSIEDLTNEMKRTERIALMLRTNQGIPSSLVQDRHAKTRELVELGLLRELNGQLLLTKSGKSVADSVAESLV
jgi:oxygen-independent coproporphyrinogen-3 oxidase